MLIILSGSDSIQSKSETREKRKMLYCILAKFLVRFFWNFPHEYCRVSLIEDTNHYKGSKRAHQNVDPGRCYHENSLRGIRERQCTNIERTDPTESIHSNQTLIENHIH